tara:strand:- start:22420 stop:23325 length:906 start_codon:yes stop_codon:yes gene_type:complete
MFKQTTKFRYIPQAICLGLLMASFAIISTPSKKLCAANLESNICDPNIWDTIVGRAWIEAQREIEISQSLITRPDSVLQLSCFDAFVIKAAGDATPFSGATDKNAIKTLITNTVTTSMTNYLGFAGYSVSSGGGTMAGLGYQTDANASFSSQCQTAMNVWTHFKCSNMPDLEAYVFDTLKKNDPRKIYTGTSVGTSISRCTDKGYTKKQQQEINTKGIYPLIDREEIWTRQIERLNSASVAASTPSYFDLVTTFSDMTSPIGACAAPIQTGVQIVTTSGASTPEMICPNPGCSYNGSSCVR